MNAVLGAPDLYAVASDLFAQFKRGAAVGAADFALMWDVGSVLQPPHATPCDAALADAGRRACLLWCGHALTVLWMVPHDAAAEGGDEAARSCHHGQTFVQTTPMGLKCPWAATDAAAAIVLKQAEHRLNIACHPVTRSPPPTDLVRVRKGHN